MNAAEFAAWARHTDRSRRGWRIDEVTLANRGELLMYRGGQEGGRYVRVSGAVVEMGTYRDAVPHIGEASFTSLHSAVLEDEVAARRALVRARTWRGLERVLAPLDAAREAHEAGEVRAEAAAERRREGRDGFDERGRRLG